MAGLTTTDRQAIQLFDDRLRQAFPRKVISVQLFGSKARGEATYESDVDVLVVLRDGTWQDDRKIIRLAARVWTETGVNVSPKVYTQSKIADMRRRGNVFLQSVEQDAVPV